jgi:hypothetical protein
VSVSLGSPDLLSKDVLKPGIQLARFGHAYEFTGVLELLHSLN